MYRAPQVLPIGHISSHLEADDLSPCHDQYMTTPSVKIEAQFRGELDALKRLREVLEASGVFIEVSHEYRDTVTVWDDSGLVIADLLVPAAERAVEAEPELEGSDRG
jgi:hypothetical protein